MLVPWHFIHVPFGKAFSVCSLFLSVLEVNYNLWCWLFRNFFITVFTLSIMTPYLLTILVLKFETVHAITLCLKYCWIYGKQCRPWSGTVFCGIWSGSTLIMLRVIVVTFKALSQLQWTTLFKFVRWYWLAALRRLTDRLYMTFKCWLVHKLQIKSKPNALRLMFLKTVYGHDNLEQIKRETIIPS